MINIDFETFRENYLGHSKKARENNELIQLNMPEGMPSMYIVASQPGVNEVLKNEHNYFVHFADYFASIPGKSDVDQKISEVFANNLGNDDPIHIELRKDIRNHFNGSAVDQHVPYIQDCVEALCDKMEEKARNNNGEIEFLWDFAKPLTFLITCHVTGLSFADEEEKQLRIQQADQAIQLINLLASDEDKLLSLEEHDKLMSFVEKQLNSFVENLEKGARTDCLLYDFAKNIVESGDRKLRSYVEIVGGLFQAGLGATANFMCLCLDYMLRGDANNKPELMQSYYLDSERNIEERREAILEMIRLTNQRLGGLLPRYAPKSGELMGDKIEGDSLVYLNFVSANMDPQGFDGPDLFKPRRSQVPPGLSKEELSERRSLRKEKNLSFSYGEHHCPGKRIALVILQVVYDELFKRFPNMEVVDMDAFCEVFGKPSEVLSLNMKLNLD